MDYTVCAIEEIEEETFCVVNENEEEDSKGSDESIEDIDNPLADEPMTDIALCAMHLPNSMKLPLDPNVWIADTGATFHATPNPSVMFKKSEKKCNDSVTMGNGKSKAKQLSGTVILL
jgi:hypothetical protein